MSRKVECRDDLSSKLRPREFPCGFHDYLTGRRRLVKVSVSLSDKMSGKVTTINLSSQQRTGKGFVGLPGGVIREGLNSDDEYSTFIDANRHAKVPSTDNKSSFAWANVERLYLHFLTSEHAPLTFIKLKVIFSMPLIYFLIFLAIMLLFAYAIADPSYIEYACDFEYYAFSIAKVIELMSTKCNKHNV
ncbi:hypothetical protein E3N88_11232 [Mikania micrantha]|uniref:Uncharacterized protein n=1 Tax=Mikania micrantha TaxID=192012 RepID=A0A5N6PCR5_9ASTR|nr:hypothetical protein E3N88_11232 [Mikania micrantha]